MKNYFTSLLLFSLINFCAAQSNENSNYIIIDVYTGNLPGAGTDRTINLTADIGGQTVIIEDLSSHINGNALERGNTDRFTYPVPNLGEPTGITVYRKKTNTIDDRYLLEKIIITRPNNKKTTFICNCWLDNDNQFHSMQPLQQEELDPEFLNNRVSVKVETGDISKAGTNANIYLSIETEQGISPPYKLNSLVQVNGFETGDTDLVHIDMPHFEEVRSINIGHDNKGPGSGWNLKKITITNAKHKAFIFNCNCWLEGDNNQRTLLHTNFREPRKYYLQSAIANKFLDVQWGNDKNGTPLHLWTENRGEAQQFYIQKAGGEYYHIKSSLGKNKYVSYYKKETKSKILISDSERTQTNKWAFEKVQGTDYYLIRSIYDFYLDVQMAANKDGTPIWTWTKNGGVAQQWKILIEEDGKLIPITKEQL